MTDGTEFEGAGERYKFLLQPVKDLANNWDLDIAKTLQEYIQRVIEEMSNAQAPNVDEHGNRKLFNFAEAALLIHGTTSVYGRKVEYVLQQAQNFFEQLREEKETQQKGKRRKGMAEEADNGEEEDGGGGGGGDADGGEENNQQHRNREPKINYNALANMLERLSERDRSSDLLPIVPIAFFPLADFEKTMNVPLCSRTNPKDVFGKRDDFKVNTCYIHEGVALLDMKSIPLINEFSELTVFNACPSKVNHENANRVRSGAATATLGPLLERTFENDEEDRAVFGCAEDGGGTFDDVGAGMEVDEDDGGEVATPSDSRELSETVHLQQTLSQEEQDRRLSGLRPSGLAHSRPVTSHQNVLLEGTTGNCEASALDKENEQPLDWRAQLADLLEPDELVNDKSKPFQRKENCTTNANKQIKARNRRIERDCRERGVPNLSTLKCYIDTRIYRHKLKKRAYAFGQFNTYLVDQAVLALNPLIYEEEKRRAELRKRLRKHREAAERAERAAQRASVRELDPVLHLPPEHEITVTERQSGTDLAPPTGEEEFDDPLDELVAEEIINYPPGEDLGEVSEESINLGDVLEVADLENSIGVQNLYNGFEHLSASQRKLITKTAITGRNIYDDTHLFDDAEHMEDLAARPSSQMEYDEIIAFHLRKYWTESERAISKFSEHIQQWEVKMTEVLEQEQTHREFNAADYGNELLDKFDRQIGKQIDFTQMLDELPQNYDQSRYLLVALILANLGNVGIEQEVADDEAHIPPMLLNYLGQGERGGIEVDMNAAATGTD